MSLSIIVPYHNEGRDFIKTTIDSIIESIDLTEYEIIVVDDCSETPLDKIDNVTVIRHEQNLGVGAAFDTGVKESKYENLFIMGSDIRFIPNNWATQIIKEIELYPKSFTCTSCVALTADNMDINKRRNENVVNGATILMFHDKKSNPLKDDKFRSIIEAQWLPRLKDRNLDSYDIPCILGAAYGVKKEWYNYVDGWSGHKKWGTLEPYISLKSWLFGGSCRIAPRIETGHIFKNHGTHGTPQEFLFYNKILVSTLFFDDYERLINFLGTNTTIEKAKEMYNKNIEFILSKREEYKNKIVYNYQDFFKRFNIDYRPEYEL
jgi:glycosyltransferase involved in cell wall biosynthesis